MSSSILALRAISAMTFIRFLTLISWIVGIILAILIGLTIYLGGWVNPWWFLLFIVLTPLTILCAAAAAAMRYLAHRLLPRPLTKPERRTVLEVTDKLTRIAEIRATPWPVVAFQIGKDVLRGHSSSYIESLVDDTTGIKKSFDDVRRLFERKELK